MKKLIFVSLLSVFATLFISPSFSQIRKIPSTATDALKEKYPDANNVSWQDKLTVFVASFEINSEKYEARFDDRGEWKSTEKEIGEIGLPAEIKDGFGKSKYADWELRNAYLIELADNTTQYRVQVAKNDIQKKNLLFNSSGRMLKDNITLK